MTECPHICLIGAGPCGLVAARNLKQAGLSFECFEREPDLGGVWNSTTSHGRVHPSTAMISSKRMTEFLGFRMPRDFPHYPRHDQVLDYLRDFAGAFDLLDEIQFGVSVERIERSPNGWSVSVKGERNSTSEFSHVVIASGHHCHARLPAWTEDCSGPWMHSSQYKSRKQLAGKRVLVVGAGNSGCDIAVEAAQYAFDVSISMRRGYHVLPKFLFGAPIDRCGDTLDRWRLPRWLIALVMRACLRVAVGPMQRYGLPRPEHSIFACHPIVNSQLLHYLAHRRITVRPPITSVKGDRVTFSDGTEESFDSILCATGYRIEFPFLPPGLLAFEGEKPMLYMNVFHPLEDSIFVVGLIQPNGGIWQLADYQSQLICKFIQSAHQNHSSADWWRQQKQKANSDSSRKQFLDTPRHAVEVDYFAYRRQLKRQLAQFERRNSRAGR